MNCEKCGKEMPADVGACPNCGASGVRRRGWSWILGLITLGALLGALFLNMLKNHHMAGVIRFLMGVGNVGVWVTPLVVIFDLVSRPWGAGKVRVAKGWLGFACGCGFFSSCLFLMIINTPNFFFFERAIRRPKFEPASYDLHITMKIAIEKYYNDHHHYPAWSLKKEENAFGGVSDKKGVLARIPTFRLANGTPLATLTTPVRYLDRYPIDPWSPVNGATYGYWNDGDLRTSATVCIIWSAGPDGVYDITIDNVAKALNSSDWRSSYIVLNGLTYDPTNGVTSRGDKWAISP